MSVLEVRFQVIGKEGFQTLWVTTTDECIDITLERNDHLFIVKCIRSWVVVRVGRPFLREMCQLTPVSPTGCTECVGNSLGVGDIVQNET